MNVLIVYNFTILPLPLSDFDKLEFRCLFSEFSLFSTMNYVEHLVSPINVLPWTAPLVKSFQDSFNFSLLNAFVSLVWLGKLWFKSSRNGEWFDGEWCGGDLTFKMPTVFVTVE